MRGTHGCLSFSYSAFVGLDCEPQKGEFVSLSKARLTSMRRINIRTVLFGSVSLPYSEGE